MQQSFKNTFLSLLIPSIIGVTFAILHLFAIAEHPTSLVPIVDEGEYMESALRIRTSPLFSVHTDHLSLLYTWFLAGITSLFGASLTGIKIIQIGMNCITGLIVFAIGKKVFSKKVGILSLFIWSLYGPIIFYTSRVLSVTLILFLYALSLYVLLRSFTKQGGISKWIAPGLLFGMAVAVRPDILIFCGAISVVIFFTYKESLTLSKRITAGSVFLALCVAPLLGAGMISYKAVDELSMLPSASGLNFYMGNNSEYKKSIGTRAGPYWDSLNELPQQKGPEYNKTIYEKNSFYRKAVLQFAMESPFQFFQSFCYKVRTLFHGYELPAVFDMYAFREHSPPLSLLTWNIGWLWFPFSFLLPFACVGIANHWMKNREHLLLQLMPFSFLFALLGFWNASRFRMALMPVFILYGASGILYMVDIFRKREPAKQWRKLLLVLLPVLLSSIPYAHFSQAYNFDAEMHTFAGVQSVYQNRDTDRAEKFILKSLELQETNAGECSKKKDGDAALECNRILSGYHDTLKALSYTYLGDIANIRKEYTQSIKYYAKALRYKPEYPLALNNLGSGLLNQNKLVEAETVLRKAVAVSPYSATSLTNLGLTLTRLDKGEEAISIFLAVDTLKPGDSATFYNLGVAYSRMKYKKKAAEYFLKALKMTPAQTSLYQK